LSWKEVLRGLGLRSTRPRLLVLSLLELEGRPMSPSELSSFLEGAVDRVTVYRVLGSLKEAGLLHKVVGKDGVSRFSLNHLRSARCEGGHPHFLCEECGRMFCLRSEGIPRVRAPQGFKVRGKQLLLYGICGECGRTKDLREGR